MSFSVTVFICTYNRGKLIEATLDSIINKQTIDIDEIVIVNGGGENNCQVILDFWKTKHPNFNILATKNINLATSRNIGLPHCNGDLILQTDDDARPFPNWVETMIDMHQQYPEAGVIGGEVVDSDGKSFLSQIADSTTFPLYKKVSNVRSVPGVNSSYKKNVVLQVGDYDVTLFRGEDVDYNWRAIKKGWEVLYVPEIKVVHVHRPTWKGLLNQHYMYGRAYYLVRTKWPEMYSVYPHNFNSIKAVLKLLFLMGSPIFDAFKKSKRMPTLLRSIMSIPIISIINYLWLIGLVNQKIFSKDN